MSTSSFLDGPSVPPGVRGKAARKLIKKKHPSVFIIITRNYNENVVVYEAFENKEKQVDISSYWLLIDDAYRLEQRANGIAHDKEQLTYIEKKMAYGYTINRRNGVLSGYTSVDINKLKVRDKPHRFYLKYDKSKGKAHALYQHENKKFYVINHVHVNDTVTKLNTPAVISLELHGYDPENKKNKFKHVIYP